MTVFQKVKFGDLYSTPSRNGVSKPSRIRGAGYPMVNMGEIFKYSRIDDSVDMEHVPLSDIEMGNSFLENGDLLFARQSLVLEGAGKCSIFLGNNTKTTFESHLIRARLDIQKTESKFYYYYFTSSPGKTKIRSIVNQVAAAGIRGSDLAKLVVDFPNLPTQTRIASVLSAYDDLIENNEKRIKTLEEMAQLLYTEWFVKFKFPGHEKVKMIESGTEYGMVPEGWEVGTVRDVANVVSGFPFKGSTYQGSGKYKIVTIKNVHDGKFVLNFDSFIDELPAKLPANCILKSGDILLSLTGNVGRICVVYGADHVLNQRVAKLDPVNQSYREFIYSLFRQRRFQQKLEAMSNGAAQQNLSPIQVKDIKIIVPKLEILNEFSQICGKYFDMSLYLQEKNQNLSQIRDILIPQLVTGRKELKQQV